MKLVYLANIRFPSERAHAAQIAHMCQAFVQNGVRVDLFVSTRKVQGDGSVEDYVGFTPSFSIHRVWTPSRVDFGSVFFLFTTLVFCLGCVRRVLRGEYDVVFTRDEWAAWFFSFFVASEKLVWESHEAKYNIAARSILRKGIKTVVISEGIRNTYAARGVAVEQMLVAHDGIDESFFGKVETKQEARAQLDLPQDKKIVMYIGGFDGWKGVETFFGASERARDILFVAIGGSEEEIASYKERYPRVRFLGRRPYRELKDNQQAADVLVIPNTAQSELSARFTSPLKLFAHMASGVPIVASDVPSIRAVLDDESGYFFEPDGAESLAERLTAVCENTDKALKKARELQEKTLQYTWSNRADVIIYFIS